MAAHGSHANAFGVDEKLKGATQFWQVRSDVGDAGVRTRLPGRQLRTATHVVSVTALPGCCVYSVLEQTLCTLHCRSVVEVAAIAWNVPPGQSPMDTALQTRPFARVQSLTMYSPSAHDVHAWHMRSARGVGGRSWYDVVLHVVTAEHSASVTRVGALVRKVIPCLHWVTALQLGFPSSSWYDDAPSQARQTASVARVGACDSYVPFVHSVTATHTAFSLPVADLISNCRSPWLPRASVQFVTRVQVASVVDVPALEVYSSSALHIAWSWHTVSALASPGETMKDVRPSELMPQVWCNWHILSDVGVGLFTCHWRLLHTLSCEQTRLVDEVAGTDSYCWPCTHSSTDEHCRSEVEVGGVTSNCSPAPHQRTNASAQPRPMCQVSHHLRCHTFLLRCDCEDEHT